ncbi:PREDICTED: gamma-glutamyl peptidase 5-like [Nelumbo nucifera]|uniref:Gamma-glutamyl peptidase 5-like n=1 Tax=Nelumbo nucifera TaxID=4432 RepID=A0A1U7ZEX3_NELNU|nr:PREDICTED: gamma-glutamyl peptidase 5-like [Nelumbo nucifera]
MKVPRERRYALLLAANDSDYVKKVYGGYFNVFVDTYGEEGDEWDLFRVVNGEFPKMEELHKYHGFVISGSPHDAHANDPWILKLCFLIQTLDAMEMKVLGICFGHQVLCRALGGKTGRAYSGWDLGVRKVKIMEDLPPRSFFNDLKEIPPTLSIIKCHQDEVWEVPVGAEVIAFSDKTGVEMFIHGDHILGIQGHPEYTKDILCYLINRLVDNNIIEKLYADDVKSTLEIFEPDRKIWEKICRSFLKRT